MENNIEKSIEIYQTADKKTEISVRFEAETVWLNQEEISQLFDRDRTVITKHINNVFKEGELDKESNVQKMHIPKSDRPVTLYNLDVIISIGYRVNSQCVLRTNVNTNMHQGERDFALLERFLFFRSQVTEK